MPTRGASLLPAGPKPLEGRLGGGFWLVPLLLRVVSLLPLPVCIRPGGFRSPSSPCGEAGRKAAALLRRCRGERRALVCCWKVAAGQSPLLARARVSSFHLKGPASGRSLWLPARDRQLGLITQRGSPRRLSAGNVAARAEHPPPSPGRGPAFRLEEARRASLGEGRRSQLGLDSSSFPLPRETADPSVLWFNCCFSETLQRMFLTAVCGTYY